MTGVQERAEDARRVEGGTAEPIDGPVRSDEGDAMQVPDESVFGDRQILIGQPCASGWHFDLPDARTGGGGQCSAAITAVAELVHEPRTGRKPTEFGVCLGCFRALIEQQHLGEVVPEAGTSFLV